MKKRVISTIIAVTLLTTATLPVINVKATPDSNQVVEFDKNTQNKYSEIEGRYNELTQKVEELDDQISTLIAEINDNNCKIENVNKEIDNTNKEIEQKKEDIAEQETVLGKRLRELYKSGGQGKYISLLFSAESFSDLISKVQDAAKIVSLDQKVVNELTDSKKKLDDSVDSLQSKVKEIRNLNDEIQEQKSDLGSKKEEQQAVAQEVKAEKDKFESENLVPMEKSIIEPWTMQATDSSKSLDEIKNALQVVQNLKSQIKSSEVSAEADDTIKKSNDIIAQKEAEKAAAASATQNSKQVKADINTSVVASGNAQNLIDYAMRFIGVDYVWGGTTPSGFDCSGFTQYVFSNAAGKRIGRTTYDQVTSGVEVSFSNLQPGDLIFPSDHHVGIYVGNGQMIHAPHTGAKVTVAPLYGFWRARRIL
ncbi:MAG: C40 family peptidase [Clostridium sp.]|nr:C40 family peptidase [Clostridium sp.]